MTGAHRASIAVGDQVNQFTSNEEEDNEAIWNDNESGCLYEDEELSSVSVGSPPESESDGEDELSDNEGVSGIIDGTEQIPTPVLDTYVTKTFIWTEADKFLYEQK
jgi:hypothetical protein